MKEKVEYEFLEFPPLVLLCFIKVNGVRVGNIIFENRAGLARIGSFNMDSEFQNQGFGSSLLIAAEKRMLEKGCEWADVISDHNAIDFYKKNGYRGRPFSNHLKKNLAEAHGKK